MPTPNWGPQAGTPMDQATFDAYVASNPPGTATNGIYGPPQIGINSQRDPFSGGGTDIYGQQQSDRAAADAGARWWEQFYSNGPASVQMPQFQTANQDQARAQQQQVIQDLQRQAMGDPNSRAQQQLRQGYGAAQAQQASLGSTMRGQSAGAAMRGVQAGQQGIQRGLAGDQQMLQLQEQQAAQQMLAQLLAQQQGQDISQAQGTANAALGGNEMNQAIQQFYSQQGLNAGLNREQTNWDRIVAQYGFDLESQNIAKSLIDQGVQTAGTLAGTAGRVWGSNPQPRTSQQTIDDAFNG